MPEILALAPDADPAAAEALARVLPGRPALLAAAVCRGGHLHVLTSKALFIANTSHAYVDASIREIRGAVATREGDDDVRVAVLGSGGLQPAHRFRSAEGTELASAINELVGQPPEGPAVAALGPGRIRERTSYWRSPALVRAGDSCDVIVVPDGVQLYFASGDYPMSTVFRRENVLGVLPGHKAVLFFETHGEVLAVEVDAEADRVVAAIPGVNQLDRRPELADGQGARPSVGLLTSASPGEADRPRRLIRSTGSKVDDDVVGPSDEPITTRDRTVIQRRLVPANQAQATWAELARNAEESGSTRPSGDHGL
ncbi:MAG: hypothetical protein QOG82_1592 [Actinomycetota bacterium]|nr:hypothetical protein [Actinomycetota bacterium]